MFFFYNETTYGHDFRLDNDWLAGNLGVNDVFLFVL